jgi:chromosome segregation ATPase
MKDIKERMARLEEHKTAINKRLDDNDEEVKSLRDSRHIHNGMLNNHTGILQGIETSIGNLVSSTNFQSTRTEENTAALRDIKVMASTFLKMMQWFFLFCSIIGTSFAFVGGKLLHWW